MVELEELEDVIPDEVLRSLSENEVNRRRFVFIHPFFSSEELRFLLVRIIHKLIMNEERYIHDLDILLSAFLNPLYEAFMSSAFKKLLDRIVELGNSHHRLLSALYTWGREDNSNQSIGDILLGAICEFRSVYSAYFGFLPSAEKKVTHEMEENPDFRLFIEVLPSNLISRNSSEYSPSSLEM